ncbi:hypothetical protein EZ428_15880 [Pedobacter frigiditerrae]|uniref:Uncharacterized protein n=1 Tax=Pedobacter frigiditerrae TaxID=2530452 RepID=A0A4R0MQP5_9SPHI|nr:DUF6266 family protein [Pedobacter frigiditerrae]TCC89180.1 hypothetical protein EZ428_15880 [Pedobacter frigiditerrae]
MATFRNGINGGFTGKVGSVVGYPLNGQWVMRGLPKKSVKNKKGTADQKACRSGFNKMQDFLRPLIPFVRVGYNLESKLRMMTAHNAAKSYNMLYAQEANGDIDCSKVCLTYGSLIGVENPTVLTDDVGFHFSWTNNAGNVWPRATDQVMVMAYNVKDQRIYGKLSGARRRDCMETIEIDSSEKGNEFHIWISFISDDRQKIAMSSYVGCVIV